MALFYVARTVVLALTGMAVFATFAGAAAFSIWTALSPLYVGAAGAGKALVLVIAVALMLPAGAIVGGFSVILIYRLMLLGLFRSRPDRICGGPQAPS
jgi:hypothetical protein